MIHPEFELDLYLIRHGESAANTRAPGAPWNADADLTKRGRTQMKSLGLRLVADGVSFDAVYSSSLKRAIESAEVVLDAMGAGPHFERVAAVDELRVATRDGQPFDQRLSDHERKGFVAAGQWWVYGPEASDRVESERLLQRRVVGWIEDHLLNDPGTVGSPGTRTVALIMHGGSIRTALQSILGFDGAYIRRLQIDNASISRLKFNRSGWFPVSINDAWHTHDLGDVNRERDQRHSG